MRKSKKHSRLKVVLALWMVFNLCAFQLYPLAAALAQEAAPADTSSSDSGSSDNNKSDTSSDSSSSDAKADSSTSQDSSASSENTAKDTSTNDNNNAASTDSSAADPASSPTDSQASIDNGAPENTADPASGQDEPTDQPADTAVSQSQETDAPPADGTTISSDPANTITADDQLVPENTGTTGPNDQAAATVTDNNQNPETADQNTQADDSSAEPTADPVITTGDAAAQADAINEVNTNITTDNGVATVQNVPDGYVGDINLMDTFYSLLDNAQELNAENGSALQGIISNNNSAGVANDVTADANTGNNEIVSANADNAITTGDASADANVVNIINTNLVGNTWLFATVNVLGDWTGNLIVPGLGLLVFPADSLLDAKVINHNSADVENDLAASANTGDNAISGAGNGSIVTGSADSQALVTNIVNTNITKNNWFFLLVNNMGHWFGNVINWDGVSGSPESVYTYDFGTLPNDDPEIQKLLVINKNSAVVENNVNASANTGGNEISAAGGNSFIETGDASAYARVVNFINTNIVGNNWFFGLVNIFGSWKGDLEFAYPDLDLSLAADRDPVQPGNSFDYTLSYKNEGKARLDDTQIMLSLPDFLAYQSDTSGHSPSQSGHDLKWSLSGLNPGEEKSFSVSVHLNDDVPDGLPDFTSVAGVKTSTEEKDLSNNSASETTDLVFPELKKHAVDLDISRSDDPGDTSRLGNITKHFITVKNTGHTELRDIEVEEKIQGPSGVNLTAYTWNIAKLKKDQHAFIEYEIVINEPAQLGTYSFSASALAFDKDGEKAKTGKAEASLNIFAALADNLENAADAINPQPAAASEILPGTIAGASDCQSVPAYIFWLVYLAYVSLLVFNLTYRLNQQKKPQWFFELLLTALVPAAWYQLDHCRNSIWFLYLSLFSGMVIYLYYLDYFKKKFRLYKSA